MVQTKNLDIQIILELSIQIGLNGLSFSILDTTTNKITRLEYITFDEKKNPISLLEVVEALFDNDLKDYDFKRVLLVYDHELCTFVPESLFNKNHLVDYLKFNTKIFPSDFISSDCISRHDLVNVFVPFININNHFIDRFGTIDYMHTSSVLVSKILDQNKHVFEEKVFAHIHHNHFELVVIKNGKLLFYNNFIFDNADDFIYYTLFSLEQLNLNPDSVAFAFLGSINETSELYKKAYTYIRNVSFASNLLNIQFASDINIEDHNHITLLNAF